MKNVIIIGTGGHAKVVAEMVVLAGDNLLGFLTTETDKTMFMGKPVLGGNEDFYRYQEDCQFVIAIGNPQVRERISKMMSAAKWYTAIHPKAVISKFDTVIGAGSTIGANAVINPGARVGAHCIVNTGAVVEHDNVIDDFAHISVGAKLAGTASVGKRTWIGIGASVLNEVRICDDCMVGAGAVVVNNIDVAGTYVGVPAKLIADRR